MILNDIYLFFFSKNWNIFIWEFHCLSLLFTKDYVYYYYLLRAMFIIIVY